MAKDPARVAAGKAAWAAMSPAKKAEVKARLKRVRPKTKGGGGGTSKPKGKALTASNPGTTAATKTKRPRAGASFQAVKVTGQAAMPLTDFVLAPVEKTTANLDAHMRARVNWDLGKGYGVAAADFAASSHRLVGHAAALTRLSVTALAPEGYLALKAYEDVTAKASARTVHRNLAIATTGYDPVAPTWSAHLRLKTYMKIKYIGAGLRLIANRTRFGRRIMRPIRQNVLKELGGAV